MSSLSASAASILLHAFLILTTLQLLLVAAMVSTTTASVPPVDDHRDDMNTTTFTNNGSSAVTTTTTPSAEDWEMYYCFLCTERHPLLIHYCPIYWDECHLNCWDAIPDEAPPAPPSPSSYPKATATATVKGKECYVMKLYKSGRYVIVERLSCDGIASCFLTCGGGELDDQKAVAMGGTVPATTTTIQGSFVPFELCNTEQVYAPPFIAGGASRH